jgi:hypothetical protein
MKYSKSLIDIHASYAGKCVGLLAVTILIGMIKFVSYTFDKKERELFGQNRVNKRLAQMAQENKRCLRD